MKNKDKKTSFDMQSKWRYSSPSAAARAVRARSCTPRGTSAWRGSGWSWAARSADAASSQEVGMQPCMIACWTCYLGCCNEAAIEALQAASDARLLEVLATLRKEGNEHPGPHTLARVLIGGNALKMTRG